MEKIRYPEDISKLKSEIPEIANLSDSDVYELYSSFSEEFRSASWLILNDDFIQDFKEWLLIPKIEKFLKRKNNDN